MIDLNSTQNSFIYASAQYMTAQRKINNIADIEHLLVLFEAPMSLFAQHLFIIHLELSHM